MKNAAKCALTLIVTGIIWYALVGVRFGTEPIQGGWLIKAIVAYAS
jgi:hypothetical protein